MTAQHDLDAILAAWLDEGPTDLPDVTRRAIVTALPTTTQARRGPLAPWRHFDMDQLGRLAAAALVAVVAIGGAVYLIGPGVGLFGPGPTPAVTDPPATAAPPTAAPATPAPTPVLSPTAAPLRTYVSAHHGFTIQHPPLWVPTDAATEDWPLGADIGPGAAWVDGFSVPNAPGSVTFVGIAAQAIPDGMTAEAWMLDYATTLAASERPCVGAVEDWVDRDVGGAAGRQLDGTCDPEITGGGTFRDVVWVIDGTSYAISGNPAVIDVMLGTFMPG